jgi:hypothetical protein
MTIEQIRELPIGAVLETNQSCTIGKIKLSGGKRRYLLVTANDKETITLFTDRDNWGSITFRVSHENFARRPGRRRVA